MMKRDTYTKEASASESARYWLSREGRVPSRFFSSEIRDSWKRCYDRGLDPHGNPSPVLVSDSELTRLRDENSLVRRLALMEMENLHQQIAGSNFIIILADSRGTIIDRIVDGVPEGNRSAGIRPGVIWREETNGTNALGLVAATQRSCIVHGEEHYFDTYNGLTCAAAPIFGQDGRVAGIIDATSNCQSRQFHTLALVKMSCLTIENGLFRDRHQDSLILEIHNRQEFLGTLHSAMLAFDDAGLLEEPNRQAKLYLDGIPLRPRIHFDEIFRTSFKDFMDRLPGNRPVHLVDHEGSSFAVRAFNRIARPSVVRPVTVNPSRQAAQKVQMIHGDPKVRSAMNMIRRAMELNIPTLIRGETGTGKELMARYAHLISGRKGHFVPVNCAALPETLIESELFGHKEGAFTGAGQGGAVGLVQQADKGTLFLDEIGAMPVSLQAKLLRFLDRMEIRPIGKTREIKLNIQLISATNAQLTGSDDGNDFRSDLLYRINTMEVCLPPLRERDDLPRIVDWILASFKSSITFEPDAMKILAAYSWPGNIRELKGLLTRIYITHEKGVINAEQVKQALPEHALSPALEHPRKDLSDHEREIILAAYEKHQGNISAVSRTLNISRNKVYKKLKEARQR